MMRLILLFSLCYSLSTFGYPAKVISITDGDTCKVLTKDKQQVTIRLASIDTPERSQAYGSKATKALSKKISGKTVEVKVETKDRYGRTVAHLYLGGRWINLEMVQDGFAWHYKHYSKDQRLSDAEVKAREAKAGLWKDADAVPPWEFRRGGKSGYSNTSKKSSAVAVTGYWLNTSSGTRHNSNCRYYKNTSKGKACGKSDGKPCGSCGG